MLKRRESGRNAKLEITKNTRTTIHAGQFGEIVVRLGAAVAGFRSCLERNLLCPRTHPRRERTTARPDFPTFHPDRGRAATEAQGWKPEPPSEPARGNLSPSREAHVSITVHGAKPTSSVKSLFRPKNLPTYDDEKRSTTNTDTKCRGMVGGVCQTVKRGKPVGTPTLRGGAFAVQTDTLTCGNWCGHTSSSAIWIAFNAAPLRS